MGDKWGGIAEKYVCTSESLYFKWWHRNVLPDVGIPWNQLAYNF